MENLVFYLKKLKKKTKNKEEPGKKKSGFTHHPHLLSSLIILHTIDGDGNTTTTTAATTIEHLSLSYPPPYNFTLSQQNPESSTIEHNRQPPCHLLSSFPTTYDLRSLLDHFYWNLLTFRNKTPKEI